jgi:hypothetical protein
MIPSLQTTQRAHCSVIRSLAPAICAPWILVTLLLSALCFGAASAETIPEPYHRPVQVELVNYLDVRRLHAGSSFFVKVVDDWAGLGCYFRSGQIFEAKVDLASPRSRQSSLSQLAVSFTNTPCVYGNLSLDLVLAAVVWNSGDNNLPHAQFPIIRYSLQPTGSVNTIQGNFNINGIEMMALNGKPEQNSIKPGDVLGIRGVKLRIGAGPDRSSILESSTRDVAVERESQFLLVPASVAFLPSSSPDAEIDLSGEGPPAKETAEAPPGNSAAPDMPPTADSVRPVPQEFLPCAPPACNVDLPSGVQEHASRSAQSIAIRPFGYAPRPQSEIEDLNDDDALAWLGSHQLIVGFNPHALIPRARPTAAGETVRRIHVVVLDLSSQKVVSTADWDLPDKAAWLWQLSGNRVLVHAGNELQVLGEDMKVDARIPLEGPLAFVRIAPNGEWIAIAVIHERHSPELHAKLLEGLGREPDEDVQIRILDRNFQTVAEAMSSLRIMPPILLNEGQVQLVVNSALQYRLVMLPWQGGSVSVARFSSSCLPSISSFAPDLLFVTTCAPLSRTHEYRVLRPNGDVLMRGRSDPQDLGQGVMGTDQKFAVKVLHATRALVEGSVFHGSDLDYAEVRVYRSDDGARTAALRMNAPPPSRGGFALSSDGSRLAVLSDSRVSLFSLP